MSSEQGKPEHATRKQGEAVVPKSNISSIFHKQHNALLIKKPGSQRTQYIEYKITKWKSVEGEQNYRTGSGTTASGNV